MSGERHIPLLYSGVLFCMSKLAALEGRTVLSGITLLGSLFWMGVVFWERRK